MRTPTGARAECRVQAGLTMAAIQRWLTKKPRSVALNVGCLFFAPFITLLVWSFQLMFWLMVGIPILAYALLMAAIGGGFKR